MSEYDLIYTGSFELDTSEQIAFIAYAGVLGVKNADKNLALYSKKELKEACKLIDRIAALEPVTSQQAVEIRASKQIVQHVLTQK